MDIVRSARSRVWLAHVLYFGIGGIWAVAGRRSFEAITGPKTDYWLVRTVGGLLTVIGGVIAIAGARRRITPEIRWLAVATSGVLTAVDVVSTTSGHIRPVYLLDALANTILIGGWLSRPDDES